VVSIIPLMRRGKREETFVNLTPFFVQLHSLAQVDNAMVGNHDDCKCIFTHVSEYDYLLYLFM